MESCLSLEDYFNPESSLSVYSPLVQQMFSNEANFLLDDLIQHKLSVGLVDAPEPQHPNHKIRTVLIYNPSWYSELYHNHPHFRRDRSIRALTRIKQNKDQPFRESDCSAVSYYFHYDTIYREFIFKRLTAGYNDPLWGFVPPTLNHHHFESYCSEKIPF